VDEIDFEYLQVDDVDVEELHVDSQVDQNGIVYDPKTDRKCLKNGAFTAV
jgi:hypothetical protein